MFVVHFNLTTSFFRWAQTPKCRREWPSAFFLRLLPDESNMSGWKALRAKAMPKWPWQNPQVQDVKHQPVSLVCVPLTCGTRTGIRTLRIFLYTAIRYALSSAPISVSLIYISTNLLFLFAEEAKRPQCQYKLLHSRWLEVKTWFGRCESQIGERRFGFVSKHSDWDRSRRCSRWCVLSPPARSKPDSTETVKTNFVMFVSELDDGAYNPLWTMKGFTQSFHFWKENKRAQSIPLNAFITYITLPWWTIARGEFGVGLFVCTYIFLNFFARPYNIISNSMLLLTLRTQQICWIIVKHPFWRFSPRFGPRSLLDLDSLWFSKC